MYFQHTLFRVITSRSKFGELEKDMLGINRFGSFRLKNIFLEYSETSRHRLEHIQNSAMSRLWKIPVFEHRFGRNTSRNPILVDQNRVRWRSSSRVTGVEISLRWWRQLIIGRIVSPHRRGFDTKPFKFSLFPKTLAFLSLVGVLATCVQLNSILVWFGLVKVLIERPSFSEKSGAGPSVSCMEIIQDSRNLQFLKHKTRKDRWSKSGWVESTPVLN